MRTLRLFALVWCLSSPLLAGQVPESDQRNTAIRHTDFRYETPQFGRLRTWQRRAAFLRKQILANAGLLPMPEKSPLNAQVFDKTEHDDYSIEKVLLETYPGFFLAGNLYRPVGRPGPHPGIVSPHGHWRYGRLENSETVSLPARGINLAKQGYVVLTYDMVGYTDTAQVAHGFEQLREQLWHIGTLGIQLWNSIRAVDFLLSLSDVDPERLGATGASGGGTQTFLLTAIDDRIRFSAPVNMISAIMQGGSPCENAPNLRIDTHNVEIAALMAPRPMLMVSATGDWTRNTPQDEFPSVREVYRLFGAETELEQVQVDAPHNYNKQSREAVYAFFGKKAFPDRRPADFKEQSYRVEPLHKMLCFWGRELPSHAVTQEELVQYLIEQAERQTAALRPKDSATLEHAYQHFREALGLSTMVSIPRPNELRSDRVDTLPNGDVLVIGRRQSGDRIPAAILRPRRANARVLPTLLVHPEGTAWVLSSSESQDGLVRQLLNRGGAVMGIDAFQTGRAKESRDIAGAGRGAELYYTTFNRTDDANRIQDILTALTYLRTRLNSQAVNLVGMGPAGIWSLYARALADDQVELVADLNQFDTASDAEYQDKLFIPGLRRAGDFRAAAVLLAPGRTLLHNTSESFPADWARAAFESAGAPDKFEIRGQGLTDEELLNRIAPSRSRRRR